MRRRTMRAEARRTRAAGTADRKAARGARRAPAWRLANLRRVACGAFVGLTTVLITASAALAAPTGASGASGGPAPGVNLFNGLTGWIRQYGWAGAPLAISIGGLLMTVEHHQQRTGNAIRAKGYIFAAGAGLIVISLAGAGTNALQALIGHAAL